MTDDERYTKLVKFLKFTLPQQAMLAQHNLTTFRACERVMEFERAISRGELIRMGAEEAEEARRMWRAQRQVLVQTRISMASGGLC